MNLEVTRGKDAMQLLENPIYKEAVEGVEQGLIRAMKVAAMGDESTHHRLVLALQLLNQITKHIETVAQTGVMAEMQTKDTMGRRIRAVAGI